MLYCMVSTVAWNRGNCNFIGHVGCYDSKVITYIEL